MKYFQKFYNIARPLSANKNFSLTAASNNLKLPFFAIIHILGKQFKITNYDLIRVQGYFPAEMGEVVKLEKVLVVGGSSFSLFGRPLLPNGLVDVKASVVEKGMTHMYTDFKYWKKPHANSRMRIHRYHRSVLRINSINLDQELLENLQKTNHEYLKSTRDTSSLYTSNSHS